jgi:iron complex transport system substrate-binding protein
VLKNGHVFNNDARSSLAGGNDYWESGTVRPDLVLADLIEVFHPDLLTDHSFVYYRQLK